jgi:hypothetical protein
MAAFAGAVFPQQAISDGYYVPEPRKSVAEVITSRISLRPASTHLFLGSIGSGKTTQLLMTRDRINREIDDTEAFYVDASDYTDITKMSHGVLTAIIGLILSEIAKDISVSDVQDSIKKICKLAYGGSEDVPIDDFVARMGQNQFYSARKFTVAYTPGILTRNKQMNSTLANAIKKVSDHINLQGRKIVLLIDGLDRLNDTTSFLNVIESDLQEIAVLNIGVVVVGALRNAYENSFIEVKKAFDYNIIQPCHDVEEDADSKAFCQAVIAGRSSPGFIDESVVSRLVYYSGGILRDLISLTQLAIEEAYVSDDGDEVTLEHVEIAAENAASMKLLDLSDDDMEILSQVATANSFVPNGAEKLRLIANSNIIEYSYPRKRYVVHPCLRKYLLVGV